MHTHALHTCISMYRRRSVQSKTLTSNSSTWKEQALFLAVWTDTKLVRYMYICGSDGFII